MRIQGLLRLKSVVDFKDDFQKMYQYKLKYVLKVAMAVKALRCEKHMVDFREFDSWPGSKNMMMAKMCFVYRGR